jgi:outer membrane protein assembly factor BamB
MMLRGEKFSTAIVLFSIALVSTRSSVSKGDDWPHWMGPTKDGVWRESGMIEKFPEAGAKIVWRKPIGGGYGGPAIAGQRVYVMERTADSNKGRDVENDIRAAGEIAGGERIRCMELTTGETIWEQSYDCPYKIAYPNGPRCTPAVDDDRVYTLGAMGMLMCLNAADGKVIWKKNLTDDYKTKPPVWGFASHPLIDGKKLIVPVGGEGSAVVALDKMTGEELWRNITTLDIAYAPLVIYEAKAGSATERQLIFWHAEGVAGLDPETGKQFWTIKFPEEKNPSETSICTPRIVGNRILISEFYKGSLLLEIGSDPPAVKEIWRSHQDDPHSQKSINAMMATPVVADGHAYGIGFDSRGQGIFRCVKLDSNELVWSKADWLEEKPILFATAFAVQNDDRYYLFADNGELLIVRLSPSGFNELSRAKILEPTTPARGRIVVWCHPAFSGGRMITRNDEEIVCVDLRKTN